MRIPIRFFGTVAMAVLTLQSTSAQPPLITTAPEDRPANGIPPAAPTATQKLDAMLQDLHDLRRQQALAEGAPQDPQQKKQIELLQKQVETQQKMIELLVEQMKKQPGGDQGQIATLEARSLQAARRDQELANAVDNFAEHLDAQGRNGPVLPGPLKELFFPSGTNESALSIYGTFAFDYRKIHHEPGGFQFGEFSPDFFLKLNDWVFFEGEISVGPEGAVDATFAQADFFLADWLTFVVGRFVAPIGWFNERVNAPFINKFPDAAVVFRQVSPFGLSLMGIQARGGQYLGCLPIKLDYAAYLSNGLNINNNNPALTDVANLEAMQDTYRVVSQELAFGGRLGFWLPEWGFAAGVSGFVNGNYTPVAEDALKLWAVDANFHRGNWDWRFEYTEMYQHAESFIGHNIRRRGLYTQLAYRPYDAACKYVANTEFAARYSYANFTGIDPTQLNLSAFNTPVDVPVNRDQYSLGVNYYFSPSMVVQCMYEFNHEHHFALHDNVFEVQLAWGF